ncbi:MAG: hypothetical protein A2Y72_04145 [Chloroflexi bacterium RBG_13_53_26]|nr:MAG: hypothetical protein A2Y72_04145 [Chloroflexi bacterium RBG_13_53_26]
MADKKPFTHRIFSDFSGDDGDPRTPGASPTICIAWVISAEEDIRHNRGVVLAMKKTIGCRPDAELKYGSFRRHRRKSEALDLLSKAKIEVIIAPVLLVFDEIGWVGCRDAVRTALEQDKKLDLKSARPDWLLFTKSGGNLMLQLADVIAGLGREYVESLLDVPLPPCRVCWIKGKRTTCSNLRHRQTVGQAKLMHTLRPLLLKNDAGECWEQGFYIRPPGTEREYLFVDCLFGK